MKNTKNLINDLKDYFYNNTELPNISDYNQSDETVKMFFNSLNDKNIKTAMVEIKSDPELADAFLNELGESLEAESMAILRYAYHNLQKASGTENEVILTEDLDQDIEDLSTDEHRFEAATALQKFSELKPELNSVTEDIVDMILDGSNENVVAATRLIKSVFSNSLPMLN